MGRPGAVGSTAQAPLIPWGQHVTPGSAHGSPWHSCAAGPEWTSEHLGAGLAMPQRPDTCPLPSPVFLFQVPPIEENFLDDNKHLLKPWDTKKVNVEFQSLGGLVCAAPARPGAGGQGGRASAQPALVSGRSQGRDGIKAMAQCSLHD